MKQNGSILLYGLLALAILSLVAGIGRAIYNAVGASKQVEWDEANRKQREAEAAKANEASTGLEVENAKAKVITRTVRVFVDKIIDRPVYRSVCVDADGLRLLNDQIRRAGDAGEPGSPLPGSAAGG